MAAVFDPVMVTYGHNTQDFQTWLQSVRDVTHAGRRGAGLSKQQEQLRDDVQSRQVRQNIHVL